MIKMFIEMDEEKIKRENKYDIEMINSYIDKLFLQKKSLKDDEGYYTNGTFESFGAIVWHLTKKSWFMENVKKWDWHNSDSSGSEDIFEVEDIISYYNVDRG